MLKIRAVFSRSSMKMLNSDIEMTKACMDAKMKEKSQEHMWTMLKSCKYATIVMSFKCKTCRCLLLNTYCLHYKTLHNILYNGPVRMPVSALKVDGKWFICIPIQIYNVFVFSNTILHLLAAIHIRFVFVVCLLFYLQFRINNPNFSLSQQWNFNSVY